MPVLYLFLPALGFHKVKAVVMAVIKIRENAMSGQAVMHSV